ncbi:unnamed protein product, partial [Mesorhabditis spiculigera]
MNYATEQFVLFTIYLLVLIGYHMHGIHRILYHEEHIGNTNRISNIFLRVTICLVILVNAPTLNFYFYKDNYDYEYVWQMQDWMRHNYTFCVVITFINSATLTIHFLAAVVWSVLHTYLVIFKKEWNVILDLLIIFVPLAPAIGPIFYLFTIKRPNLPGSSPDVYDVPTQAGSYFNYFCIPIFQISMLVIVLLQVCQIIVYMLRHRMLESIWPLVRISACILLFFMCYFILDISLSADMQSLYKYGTFVCCYAVFLIPVLLDFGKPRNDDHD